MNRPILELPHSGKYKTIVCGNCHVLGHRSEGNKNNTNCLQEPCYSYIRCGQRKKTSGAFRRNIRTLTKRCKQLKSDIDILRQDKQNLVSYRSKQTALSKLFLTVMTRVPLLGK